MPIDTLQAHPLQSTFNPPGSPEENRRLQQDIGANGQRDPIRVLPPNNRAVLPAFTILDGHRRAAALDSQIDPPFCMARMDSERFWARRMDPTIFQDPNSRKDMAHLSGSPEAERLRLLLKWLAGNNARRRALATEIVAGTGKLAVPVLLDEALAPRMSAQQRIRIFDVMERIGQPLDMDQWMELYSSVWRYGPRGGSCGCSAPCNRSLRKGPILAAPTYGRPNNSVERPSRGLGSSHHPVKDVFVVAFTMDLKEREQGRTTQQS
ncbi:MAG: hypothetical protein ABSH08_20835 [Tepidisphaeraceae bacterium]